MQIKQNEPLKKRNCWKVGGKADYFCQPESPEQLREALQWASEKKQAVSVLGSGTNVLISDQGVEGLLISTARLNHVSVEESQNHLVISCGAGLLKSRLMKLFQQRGLVPALFLSGLPGNVGGGIVMNAGLNRPFKPSEFSEITKSFEVMSVKGSKRYHKEDITWTYRASRGWGGIIHTAQFEWPLKPLPKLNEQIRAEMKRRISTQPLNRPSCGSVFKNPYPLFAGKLIEEAGLKGLSKGSAQVSEKHGNFIVNQGGAKARDIHDLIQEIRKKVYDRFAVSLEPEVRLLGCWPNRSAN